MLLQSWRLFPSKSTAPFTLCILIVVTFFSSFDKSEHLQGLFNWSLLIFLYPGKSMKAYTLPKDSVLHVEAIVGLLQ